MISCRQRRSKLGESAAPSLLAAKLAAYFSVRVTAGWGRASAVHTSGRNTMPALASSGIATLYRRSLRLNAAAAASPAAADEFGEAMHTSKAALRPGTAAVVRISAGLSCVLVGPVGSVRTLESASRKPSTSTRTHA